MDEIYDDFNDIDRTLVAYERLRYLVSNVVANAKLMPDPDMGGLTDCWGVPLEDVDALNYFLTVNR